jgi:hypothetical protein
VAIVQALYATAPSGALIVEGNRNYPNQFLRYEQFVSVAIDREPVSTRRRIMSDPAVELARWLSGYDGAAYVLFTDSMGAASDELGLLPTGAIDAMAETLRSSPAFEVVHQSERAVVFALADAESVALRAEGALR